MITRGPFPHSVRLHGGGCVVGSMCELGVVSLRLKDNTRNATLPLDRDMHVGANDVSHKDDDDEEHGALCADWMPVNVLLWDWGGKRREISLTFSFRVCVLKCDVRTCRTDAMPASTHVP